MNTAASSTSRVCRFGPFELDLRSGELASNGRRQTLPEQPLALLKALLERPGELVTRDELRHELWPGDTFVDFEHGLNAAVKRLRDALGDSAESPRFIETVPRRGYRFVAPVEGGSEAPAPVRQPDPVPAPVPAPRPRRWWWAASAAMGVVAATTAGAWWALRNGTRRERDRAKRRARAAQPDAPDVRSRTADRRHVVAGWPLHRVRLRQGRQLRHLGATRHGRRRGAGDEIAGAGHGARLVTGRQHDRVPLGTRRRRPVRRAVAWRHRAPPDLVRRAAEVVAGRLSDTVCIVGAGGRATYVVALDGSPAHPVLESLANDDLLCVSCRAWHPDGRRVSILGETRSQGFGAVHRSARAAVPPW